MRRTAIKRAGLATLCVVGLALGAASPVQAAFDDPIFVYRPVPPPDPTAPKVPPPAAKFEGPCGLAVDNGGNFLVSDYYHHAVNVFNSGTGYVTQIAGEDPLDGPCGLALDATDHVYVNNFHRNVVKFEPSPIFGAGTVISGVGVEPTHPTGVAVDKATGTVYVDQRTYVSAFNTAGTELEQIGAFADGFGIAVSKGLIYVPDAGTDTVLIYGPSTSTTVPIATIDGAGTPAGHFTSLHNAAVAVDEVSGEIYVVDDLTPLYTSHHEGVVYVFDEAGAYEGRLKHSVDNALPAGLAVDNSSGATQGRVYVTSGNSELASVYAYAPHAATTAAVPLPSAPNAGGGGGDAPVAATAAPAAMASAGPLQVSSAAGPTGSEVVSSVDGREGQRRRAAHRELRRGHHAKHRAAGKGRR
jgi:DNA-binding beta-propeller fold protein YncE